MRSPRNRWLLLGCAMIACSEPAAAWPNAAPSYLGDQRFVAHEHASVALPPRTSRHDGTARSLSERPPLSEARRVALAWLRALRAGDGDSMEEMLAPQVLDLASGTTAEPARVLSERCLRDARALAYQPDPLAEGRSDALRVQCDTLGRRGPHTRLPQGLDAGDVVVTFEAGDATDARFPCSRALFVRPGPRAVIVAVLR